MELSHLQLDAFNLYTVETGRFMLDGGAMFGVVPKTLWAQHIEPDAKNRIPMAMRCLLVESKQTGKVYLIDNGIGRKFNDKMMDIYQVDYSHSNLADSLQYHGFHPDNVTDIIFTHLHFDHCGGTTFYDEAGTLCHTFPNASYHVNHRHWQTATKPNAREKASFLPDNIQPLEQSGRLHLVDDFHTFEKGLSTLPVNGHTLGQQLPIIESNDNTIAFVADLLPTHAHIPLPWVMGYDMQPAETLKEKEAFLDKADTMQWHLFLEHDANQEIVQIGHKNGKYHVTANYKLDNI